MPGSIQVKVSGKLEDHVRQQTENGLYEDAGEYIRALIRQDLQSEEDGWRFLEDELAPALAASDDEYVTVRAEDVIRRNIRR
ncbi:Arc/MetJ-type ribon-helix-helix transcriptional regulator [Rhizobium aquaticum]|uniref:Arc/MetJ-type ribon-helix-helix transcriptional regulator n=1 Tax=Rhizobium aquaticum TaxID=1549636 RepID=A0ABV2J2X4_9HYPH